MFNSNIPATALLSIEGSGLGAHTPKTPEILNSLIAMTSPLDNLFNPSNSCSAASTPVVTIRNFGGNPNGQVCTAYPCPTLCSSPFMQSNLPISISISVALAGQQSFQLLGIATRLASGHSQHAQCAAGKGAGQNRLTVYKYMDTYV